MKTRLALLIAFLCCFIGTAYLFQKEETLSQLISQKELSFGAILIGLLTASLLGMVHALSPGHGKALVTAYLVGTQGTIRQACWLGGIITFTHTISVFLLGLTMLFLSRHIFPEKIIPWLGTISGISIIVIGLGLFWNRLMHLLGRESGYHFGHHHHHENNSADHHSHNINLPLDKTNLAGLIALGVSGGLVPCPSALVLLLSAIAIGRTAFGLLLLVAFSFGLAAVLIGIGCIALYARDVFPQSKDVTNKQLFRWLPVATAVFIMGIGCVMTGVSLGIFRSFHD